MKINKKIVMLMTLGCLVAPLVACNNPVKPPVEGGDEPAEVIFWHTMGKTIQEKLDNMITEFRKEHPNITITHVAKGDYNAIKTACENAIAAADVPTMAFCYPDHVANYLSSEQVVNLQTYLDDPELTFTEEDGLVDDIIEGYWNEGKSYTQEGIYSAPFYKSTEVMFYNKTVFDAKGWSVPTTWEQMETLMETISKDPDYGKTSENPVTPLGYDSDDNLFITMCEQYGIPYTTNENITKPEDHFLFNNAEAKNMVKRIKGWYDKGYFITKGTDPTGAYTSTSFKNGKLLMTVGSTGGTSYNYSDNFEIGVAPIPGGTKNSNVIMQGPSVTFFRRCTPAAKKAAWKFYKYCIRKENSALFASITGYSPVRESSFTCDFWKEFVEDTTITGSDALVRQTVESNQALFDKYFVSATFKGSSTARSEVGGIISTVLTGAKGLEEAFEDAYDNCKFAA